MSIWSHLFVLLTMLIYAVVIGIGLYFIMKKAIKDGLLEYDKEKEVREEKL